MVPVAVMAVMVVMVPVAAPVVMAVMVVMPARPVVMVVVPVAPVAMPVPVMMVMAMTPAMAALAVLHLDRLALRGGGLRHRLGAPFGRRCRGQGGCGRDCDRQRAEKSAEAGSERSHESPPAGRRRRACRTGPPMLL